MNYGVQWSLYPKKDGPSVQFLFGQTYRLREEAELTDTMGYHHNLSSYVGRIKVDYKFMHMMYRFRLEEETFSPQKNDIVFEVIEAEKNSINDNKEKEEINSNLEEYTKAGIDAFFINRSAVFHEPENKEYKYVSKDGSLLEVLIQTGVGKGEDVC